MVSNTKFFEGSRAAPAVLKHGLLKRYPPVFASAAGKRPGRVVLLDGYAGRGTYDDGSPGSPLLLLDTAAKTSDFRTVECVFVELEEDHFDNLNQLVEERKNGAVLAQALHGDLSDHLDEVMKQAEGAALFAFLDPFGTALRFEQVTDRILARPESSPTEVLLHVSVGAIRRIGGLLRKRGDDSTTWSDGESKTIARVDEFLGGDWWHVMAHDATEEDGVATKIAERVIAEYCKRVGAATSHASFQVPVRRRPDLTPEYYLVLFARHRYAFWRFNDALSSANVEWQEAWRGKANADATTKAKKGAAKRAQKLADSNEAKGILSIFDLPEAADDQPDLFQPTIAHEVEPFDESAEAERWVQIIEKNLTDLIRTGSPFKIIDNIAGVYSDALGLAREKHVRQAIKNLYASGLSPDDGKGNDFYKRLIKG